MILVALDTFPRGDGVPGYPADSFGVDAGCYIDATEVLLTQNYPLSGYL